ncbi:Histone deacetylase complex subunit [Microsporum canis]
MNPRRSSRARATHPAPAMQHSASSSSLNSLSRPERATRSNNNGNKPTPPRRTAAQRSQSLDDAAPADTASSKHDATSGTGTRQQRPRGAREEVEVEADADVTLTGDEFDEEGEEEITRCICGHQDYPGLPAHAAHHHNHNHRGAASSRAAKDDDAAGSGSGADALSDDAGSLFIQCDECKVWQHGGCVGIMEEASSPDEYFCERCRKDLHSIIVGPHGQKSSQYLPVAGSTSSASSTTSRGSAKTKDKKSKSNDTSPRTKRRTMNSRDAAYDEEELLRRAIEESKEDTASLVEETGSRRGKRSRSVSEINKQAAKRQRTSSPSPSSRSKQSRRNTRSPSEEETKSKTASVNGNQKKTRATRNQREKEVEPEPEPEKDAVPEPVSRRKGRADRRKGEDSEPPETASPSKPTSNALAQSAPDTPTASTPVLKPATRKSGRPPARRGRLGRNQYTRDRDPPNGAADTTSNSPRRGQSRDDGNTGDSPTSASNAGPNGLYPANGESGKASRPRYMNPNRTTMNDMRRRVAAILEFISRLQVEMAASGEQPTRPPGDSTSTMATTSRDMAATIAKAEALLNGLTTNGVSSAENQSSSETQGAPTSAPSAAAAGSDRDFKDLTSGEMMDVLTRGLFKWQELFGKYGDK